MPKKKKRKEFVSVLKEKEDIHILISSCENLNPLFPDCQYLPYNVHERNVHAGPTTTKEGHSRMLTLQINM